MGHCPLVWQAIDWIFGPLLSLPQQTPRLALHSTALQHFFLIHSTKTRLLLSKHNLFAWFVCRGNPPHAHAKSMGQALENPLKMHHHARHRRKFKMLMIWNGEEGPPQYFLSRVMNIRYGRGRKLESVTQRALLA